MVVENRHLLYKDTISLLHSTLNANMAQNINCIVILHGCSKNQQFTYRSTEVAASSSLYLQASLLDLAPLIRLRAAVSVWLWNLALIIDIADLIALDARPHPQSYL